MADEPRRINFYKIVENAISIIVVGIVATAGSIVWKGATSVDARVDETKKDFNMLIGNLSKKLSRYEVQLESQSNQLDAVYIELKTIKPLVSSVAEWRTNRWSRQDVPVRTNLVQQAIQQQIQQELLKK